MPRSRQEIPTYRKITSGRASGRAAVTVYRADGTRTNVILPGAFGSAESKAEYEAILAQLRCQSGLLLAGHLAKHDITVAELVLKFMQHAETYYLDAIDKNPTSEIATLRAAVRPLVRLFGNEAAVHFGPLALQNLRDALVSGSWISDTERAKRIREGRPIGMARSTINKNVNRIKLVFKWGASQELISASVPHALATVAGLRRGRSGARETLPVKPISSAIIDETIPHLPPIVKDMVKILLLTGMRCGEICIMRASDLDTNGEIWLYRPMTHKGKWRGQDRIIAIGPVAQTIIRKYLGTKIDAYLFSPAAQVELIRSEKRSKRKTPLYPSHTKRLANTKKSNGQRRPGERFNVRAFNRAIARACERAAIEASFIFSVVFQESWPIQFPSPSLGDTGGDPRAARQGEQGSLRDVVADVVGVAARVLERTTA